MKKSNLFICSMLFLAGSLQVIDVYGQNADYTQGLAIWFDSPNSLKGRTPWFTQTTGENSKPITAGGSNRNLDAEWESKSLPIGNGSIGANIMGSIGTERITLNEKSLWRGGPNTVKGAEYYWNVNKQSAHVLKEIREAFANGDEKKAAQLTRKNFNSTVPYEANREEAFRFGSFTTMGEFYIATGLSEENLTDYKRILSLDSALAVVQFKKNGTRYTRQFFTSFPDNVLVIRFSANQGGKQNLLFSYAPNPLSEGNMQADGTHGLVYTARLDNNQMAHAIRIQAVAKGGNIQNDGQQLAINGADEVLFLVTADTDYKMNFTPDFNNPQTYVGVNPLETTKEWMAQAQSKRYDELFRAHYADYSQLFNRVQFRLNNSEQEKNLIPTPQRLKNYRKDGNDPYLETLYYQFGRYLLIACSRPGNLPANLQGMWHNNVDGPWRVDYHNNINLQMNYWPACPTNLPECELALVDFIRTLEKPGEHTAQAYFGARGWTTSVSSNIFGFTSPLESEDMSWNFSPVAGPWLATHVWNYYDYTRDLDFLRKTGYPLIRSSARFAMDYLWHRPDGSYTAAPSTSPEHGPIDEGTTFAHGVIREILLDAIEASKVLGTDRKERKQWEKVLEHMAPYQIGRYGQLMEWSKDIDDPTDEHRHVNHLFGLHPGKTISPITTPELANACRVVLEHRGDGATGWSMGWKLNQWARLQDGNHAYKLYGNLLKNGTLDNLWDTHAPFQIDGNFGGTSGVTEMLLQSHAGFIQLLPALPDAWDSGEIRGLRARGNFEVSIRWEKGKLVKAELKSMAGEPCVVKYGGQELKFKTQKGKSYSLVQEQGQLRCL